VTARPGKLTAAAWDVIEAGPIVTGSTHLAFTVEPHRAREAGMTVTEQAPEDAAYLLDMLGITGRDGPDGGRWRSYSFGRPGLSGREKSAK
jgi:hypothetical protein